MSAENELAVIIGRARERWTRYVEDCNPVDELDEQGRTLDQAIAVRVSAELVGLRERLQAAEAQRDALRDGLRDTRERIASKLPVLREMAKNRTGSLLDQARLKGKVEGNELALSFVDELLREDQEAPKC